MSTNTAVGASALAANTTGALNLAVGYQALTANTSGNNNDAFGAYALKSNLTGAQNVAIGQSALELNTASNNTALGHGAAAVNTSGTAVVALGRATLVANTTGSYNTGVGMQALASNTTASNNTAVGYQAGYSNTTGTANVILGVAAGYTATTANYNTLIGRSAGYSLTTGSANTFVGGYDASNGGAGALVTTGSKNTILGVYNGNQGGLDIRTANNYIVLSDGDGNPRAFCNGSNYWAFNTVSPDNTTIITVQANSGGNGMAVKAGTNGNYGIYFNNTSNSTVGGIIINSGSVAYNTTSDYRLKENIQPMTGALEKVALLKPCTYTWKATGEQTQGFIAHELAEVVPDAVSGEKDAVNEDGSIKAQGIDTSFLVATLTAAIQELKAEFDAYKEAHP